MGFRDEGNNSGGRRIFKEVWGALNHVRGKFKGT